MKKTEIIRLLTMAYGRDRVLDKKNPWKGCLAIRNYLKANFSNWTSGNNDIDNLIQKCQLETIKPNMIIEWIPYNHLQDIKYLTKGGCSEIYTADWVNGRYEEWDSKNQQLKRWGVQAVILKKLENVENANRSWFEEVCM